MVGVDEREVADEDRHALAVPARLAGPTVRTVFGGGHDVRGRLVPAGVGVVHHVVVEQRERMHQLEGGAGVDVDLIVGGATRADVAPVAEGRSQPLAARQHESADLVDRLGEFGSEHRPPVAFGGEELVEAAGDTFGEVEQEAGALPDMIPEGYSRTVRTVTWRRAKERPRARQLAGSTSAAASRSAATWRICRSAVGDLLAAQGDQLRGASDPLGESIDVDVGAFELAQDRVELAQCVGVAGGVG